MSVSVDGHRKRMRDRVEFIGPEEMRPQDLMEFLLYYSLPRRDTKKQAFDMIERFGSIRGVLEADEDELIKVDGIGRRTARWLKTLGNMVEAYAQLRASDRRRIENILGAEAYFREFFKGATYREVWQCSLNNGGTLLSVSRIADNSAWAESGYLREALAGAIFSRASSVVIGQFCPKPGAEFEEYDVHNTVDYAMTLYASGIQLLDHVLICPDGTKSMFASGLLDGIRQLPGEKTLQENYLNIAQNDFEKFDAEDE